MTEDLVGKDIHGEGDRTSGGTLLALITGLQGFTAGLHHFRQERPVFLVRIHLSPRRKLNGVSTGWKKLPQLMIRYIPSFFNERVCL
jgi:hypothetical protein